MFSIFIFILRILDLIGFAVKVRYIFRPYIVFGPGENHDIKCYMLCNS